MTTPAYTDVVVLVHVTSRHCSTVSNVYRFGMATLSEKKTVGRRRSSCERLAHSIGLFYFIKILRAKDKDKALFVNIYE